MVIQVPQAVRALWWLELPNVESINAGPYR